MSQMGGEVALASLRPDVADLLRALGKGHPAALELAETLDHTGQLDLGSQEELESLRELMEEIRCVVLEALAVKRPGKALARTRGELRDLLRAYGQWEGVRQS